MTRERGVLRCERGRSSERNVAQREPTERAGTPRLFLCHRKSDTAEATRRLYEALQRRLRPRQVFMDEGGLRGGEDLSRKLPEEIGRSTVVFVMIGAGWLEPDPVTGRPRLLSPNDWVRREIEAALKAGARVQPVLVNDAGALKVLDKSYGDLFTLRDTLGLRLRTRIPDWNADLATIVEFLVERGFRLRQPWKVALITVAVLVLVIGAVWCVCMMCQNAKLDEVLSDRPWLESDSGFLQRKGWDRLFASRERSAAELEGTWRCLTGDRPERLVAAHRRRRSLDACWPELVRLTPGTVAAYFSGGSEISRGHLVAARALHLLETADDDDGRMEALRLLFAAREHIPAACRQDAAWGAIGSSWRAAALKEDLAMSVGWLLSFLEPTPQGAETGLSVLRRLSDQPWPDSLVSKQDTEGWWFGIGGGIEDVVAKALVTVPLDQVFAALQSMKSSQYRSEGSREGSSASRESVRLSTFVAALDRVLRRDPPWPGFGPGASATTWPPGLMALLSEGFSGLPKAARSRVRSWRDLAAGRVLARALEGRARESSSIGHRMLP